MAQFLNTSGTNYFLEELIKNARERLMLISPFLKLNDRIKELLEDKNRLKLDVRIVYGKNELQPEEISWLRDLSYVRTSFCKNLHAKCYLNEEACIITSLNLYEFSQINNNEMGVFLSRSDDEALYRDAFDEAQRIIRISDEVRMSLERVTATPENSSEACSCDSELLTSSKLARQHKLKTGALLAQLTKLGYLETKEEKHYLTEKGKNAGATFRVGKHGCYFLWPATILSPCS